MHKVFISYHHANDQRYKDLLLEFGEGIFIDKSVDTGDISDDLDDQTIRTKIRDEYLRDSSVTIVLVGSKTRNRKHVDWEIYSSMIDGKINKKSGVLAISLATNSFICTHGKEEQDLFPEIRDWTPVDSRADFERRHPDMPERIIDNYRFVSVIPWNRLTAFRLSDLLDITFERRSSCDYIFTTPMRRKNS